MSYETGLNRHDGQLLTGMAHIMQSIEDILTTPKQSRVMRPEYGSDVFKLIDRPINPAWLVDLYYEAVVSIHRWEPRVRVRRIVATEVAIGRVTIDLLVRLKGFSNDQWIKSITVVL